MKTDNDNHIGRILFYLCAVLTLWWMYIVAIEAFGKNFFGHSVTWEMTSLWGTTLTIYVGRKNVANWGKSIQGKRVGEYLAAIVIIYAAVIFALYIHYGWVKIPEQLIAGIHICLGLLGGNEIIKTLNQRRIENKT